MPSGFRTHVASLASLACCSIVLAAIAGAADHPATTGTSKAPAAAPARTNRWAGELAGFQRADTVNPPPPNPIVFAGSSSFRLWTGIPKAFPGRPILNRGFGGSHMSDLNEHFDQLVAQYRPSVILIYEGDNDIAGEKSPDRVFADFQVLRGKIRAAAPEAHCGYVAIKPSPSRLTLMPAQKEVNSRIAESIRDDPRWTFLDTFSPILGADGLPDPACFVKDNLHLNAEGYRRWERVIGPWLDKVGPKWPQTVTPGGGATRP